MHKTAGGDDWNGQMMQRERIVLGAGLYAALTEEGQRRGGKHLPGTEVGGYHSDPLDYQDQLARKFEGVEHK
jgi:hypothetical protein